MALVNRKLKWKEADEIPLIDGNDGIIVDVHLEGENDDEEESFKQQGISLWVYDAVFLFIDCLQYYALLLSLSNRWGWPLDWIKATHFTYLANFDVWEFWIVQSGAYNRSKTAFVDTKTLGFNYASYLAAWGTLMCILLLLFSITYIVWMKRRPLYLLLHIARLKRIFFIVIQLISLPFGIATVRVFHCRNGVMDVQNTIACYSGIHIGLMAVVALCLIIMFVVFPITIARTIKEQVFSSTRGRHEGYLQLKEAEYEQGLDILWYVGQFHLFSSYKRFWAYYNPLKFIFKFLLLIAYGLSMNYMFSSSAAISMLFFVAVCAVLIKKPFRVKSFNMMICVTHFYLFMNALIGNFMNVPPWEDPANFVIVSFLRSPTLLHILIAISGWWLLVFVLWVIYLVLWDAKIIGSSPLWPRLSFHKSNDVGEDTRKYMRAVLRGRHTLEHALSSLPLFAPVHELSRQIQIINAFCREAEFIHDPTHDTLWDLLDELIEGHNRLTKVSVFGTSGKRSIRETAKEFLKLMPLFAKRLAQRDYDLILVPPVKRRLLLKMYALSVFINGSAEKRKQREEISKKVQTALRKHEEDNFSFYESQDGLISEMGSTHIYFSHNSSRPNTTDTLDGRHSTSVAGFLEKVESWTKEHPKPASSKGSRPTTASSFKTAREGKTELLLYMLIVKSVNNAYFKRGAVFPM